MKSLNRFFTNSLYVFGSAGAFKAGIGFLTSFVLFRTILPEEMGLWASFSMIQSYALIVGLGISSTLVVDVPYLIGQDNIQDLRKKLATTEFYLRVITVLIIGYALLTLFWYLYEGKISLNILTYCSVVSISVIAVGQNFVTVTYRGSDAFKKLGYIYFYHSLLQVILLVFPLIFSYYGLIIFHLLSNISLLMLTYRGRPIKVKPKFDFIAFRSLVSSGFPLFSMNYIQSTLRSLGMIFLTVYGDLNSVAQLAMIFTLDRFMIVVPTYVSQYLSPKMSEILGSVNGKNNSSMLSTVKKLRNTNLKVSTFSYLSLLVVIPNVVRHYLPNYIEVIFPWALYSLVSVLRSIQGVQNALNSAKNYKLKLGITVLKVFLYVVGFSFLILLKKYDVSSVVMVYIAADIIFILSVYTTVIQWMQQDI